ncbi:hypothetical protein JCM3263A_13560 [Thermobifida fusca]
MRSKLGERGTGEESRVDAVTEAAPVNAVRLGPRSRRRLHMELSLRPEMPDESVIADPHL